ncbi:MAG: thioredoxin fold domain-containing protein [Candidatus Babeliaceae bacterium]|nr:thioredoxin fold domain-containing protein [Candidatus Babeliaceae bacterium]
MVVTITKDNYKKDVEEATLPVVIDVYATWCGPCQMVKPVFEQVARELADKCIFGEINVEESRELAAKFGVTSIPTFIFIHNNEIKGKERGYFSADELKTKIQAYFGV